jgi:hypothetical protein
MFANVPLEQRVSVLKDNCDHAESTSYMKDLTQEELDVKRERHIDNCIDLSRMKDELKEIKDRFKESMSPLEDENKRLLIEVKTRKEEKKGWLFEFRDHEAGMVNVYDETGEFVNMRRMRPDEKQAKLFVAHGATGSGE